MWYLRCPRHQSLDVLFLSTHTLWRILSSPIVFKYHLYADDSFIKDEFISLARTSSPSPRPTTSNRHFKLHTPKTEPPDSPFKLALAAVFLIWLMATPFFQCSSQNFAVIFTTSLPCIPHVLSISQSCWIYIRSISRI